MTDARLPNGGAYDLVEGLHLRQWAMRIVLPLAALATNGAGPLDVAWLPRHDAPGWPPSAEMALAATGGALVAVSAVLRVLAKGVLVRKTTLTTVGVYGVVRHPFYLANLVGAVGTFLVAGSLGAVVAAVWLVAAAPIYAVTVAGEERALARLYPAEFAAFASRVRALVPGLPWGDRSGASWSWTWTNLVAEREPPRLARFLAGAATVFGLTLTGVPAWAVLGTAAGAFAVSYALPGGR